MTLGRRLIRIVVALVLTLACPGIAVAQGRDELRTYDVPVPLVYRIHNDDYTVRVRSPGGPWQSLYEFVLPVDTDTRSNASMVYFDFSGTVEMEIQKNNGRFAEATVAPLSSGIVTHRDGSILRLTLTRPERFSIQFDDDRLHNLHVLAGALPPARPTGANVRYFGPGVHTPPDGKDVFPVASGDRIFLDGGAILLGAFDLTGLSDVAISGRGLLYDPGRAIDLEGSRRIDIGDLILVNGPRNDAARVVNVRNSDDVAIHDIAGFTSGKWSDGINISTSHHVRVADSYLRVSDDAVVVYAVPDCPLCRQRAAKTGIADPLPPGDTFDIQVRNMRIWNDVAHALYVAHFGDLATPRTIHDVSFDNIDIMNLDEDDPEWDGALAIYAGDRVAIRNVAFSNIRVDRIEEGRLISIVAGESARYNKAPGRSVTGVTLRNIRYTGSGMPGRSIIRGLSPDTSVRDVAIDNLTIAGKRIRSFAEGDIDVGPFVSGATVK